MATPSSFAEAYLRKVNRKDLVARYVGYIRGAGATLIHSAEHRGFLLDPFNEDRLRKMAENAGEFLSRKHFLTSEQQEAEIRAGIERARTEPREEALKWHEWHNQMLFRIANHFEARYRRWEADAIERVQRGGFEMETTIGPTPESPSRQEPAIQSDGEVSRMTNSRTASLPSPTGGDAISEIAGETMPDSFKKLHLARLADLQEHTRLTIEAEFRRLKAEHMNSRELRACYCEGLRKIVEILYPTGAGLGEPVIDDLIELTFEVANRIELRQPSLPTRGFFADVMDMNDELTRTSHPFDRPMPPERPRDHFPHRLEAKSSLHLRRETFGGVEVSEGTRDAFRRYLQPEIECILADILEIRAAGNIEQGLAEAAMNDLPEKFQDAFEQ